MKKLGGKQLFLAGKERKCRKVTRGEERWAPISFRRAVKCSKQEGGPQPPSAVYEQAGGHYGPLPSAPERLPLEDRNQ